MYMRNKRVNGWYKFNPCHRVSFILLLWFCYCRLVKGVVNISPSPVAPVCQVGGQLELTCSIAGEFKRWEFTVTLESGLPQIFTPGITPGSVAPPVTINSTTFTFSRISATERSPLISRMTIVNVSEGLNGVTVRCVDVQASESANTTIQIINADHEDGTLISNFTIRVHSEMFASNRITLLLEWTISLVQGYIQKLLRNVSIDVVPGPEMEMIFTGNRTLQLTLLYNKSYNVSITQPGICGQANHTQFIKRNYSKCSDPMNLVHDHVKVDGYDSEDPALPGKTITFTCSLSGITPNGPSSSTCMSNGEWNPNPMDVNCTGPEPGGEATTSNSATTSSESTKGSESDSNEGIKFGIGFGIAAAFLIAVIIITVILLLALFLRRKGSQVPSHRTRKLDSEYDKVQHKAQSDPSNQSHKVEEAILLYADIGSASFSKQQSAQTSTLLNLDDSRVEYAQLDHTVHKDEVSTLKTAKQSTDNDNKCPPVNLDNLLIQLRPQVSSKWRQFGEAAGIEKDVLDKFAECHLDQCIVELFDYWLRFSTEPLTWKTVADVLKAINLTELGQDIERVYTTGTLPIEVDMNRIPDLSLQEEEPPPPLPARSENLYIDTPSHTLDSDSQRSNPSAASSLLPPSSTGNERSVPARPPKPAHMKSANTSAAWSSSFQDRN